jgi:ATPase, YjeE family
MINFFSKSEEETEQIAENLAKQLNNKDIIALYGELGAGKTAFIRGLARGLKIDAYVCSPTFAIVHEYDGDPPLIHFDMYRVITWEDLYSTGFYDYMERDGILAIEWSENIEDSLPENIIKVKIDKEKEENSRNIIIE